MTNYERMQQDKEFCAAMLADATECGTVEAWMRWLDAEQREVSDERAQEAGEESR